MSTHTERLECTSPLQTGTQALMPAGFHLLIHFLFHLLTIVRSCNWRKSSPGYKRLKKSLTHIRHRCVKHKITSVSSISLAQLKKACKLLISSFIKYIKYKSWRKFIVGILWMISNANQVIVTSGLKKTYLVYVIDVLNMK